MEPALFVLLHNCVESSYIHTYLHTYIGWSDHITEVRPALECVEVYY
jgi:hypothetical protein